MKNNWQLMHGIVCVDKVHNSRIVKVYVNDILPFLNGELGDNDGLEGFEYIDDELDEVMVDEAATTNHITAEWFSMETNRVFPPDMRKGEQVLVIKYSDEDLYYWLPLGRDDNLRKLELHRIAVSDDIKTDKKLDDLNTYFFELDTLHFQRIRIVTNKSNGEDYKYEFVIDAQNDYISMSDDIGNEVILESKIPRVKLINSRGTTVDLNKDDAIVLAPRDIILHAKRQVVIKATNITFNGTEAIKNTTTNFGVDSSEASFKQSTCNMYGGCKFLGPISCTTVQAESYSTGGVGSAYPDVKINVGNGSGTTNEPEADAGNGGEGNRFVAAHPEVSSALKIIADELQAIDGEISYGYGTHGTIDGLADGSLMPKNKGE